MGEPLMIKRCTVRSCKSSSKDNYGFRFRWFRFTITCLGPWAIVDWWYKSMAKLLHYLTMAVQGPQLGIQNMDLQSDKAWS